MLAKSEPHRQRCCFRAHQDGECQETQDDELRLLNTDRFGLLGNFCWK